MKDLTINGARHSVEVPDEMPLLWVLRDVLGMNYVTARFGSARSGITDKDVAGLRSQTAR